MGATGQVAARGSMGAVDSREATDSARWTTAARHDRGRCVWLVRDREEESGHGTLRTAEPPVASPEPATPRPSARPDTPDLTPGSAPSEVEDEDDARELRMERVAVLFGEITAATRAFLAAVAACDRHGDWRHAGFGSCAEWLAWRIGVTRNTANEKVRVALALEELPLTSEAMARGELSFSKVRALTRKATPDTEPELLELARAGSAHNLERVLRSWTELDGVDEARRERALHRSRRFSVFPDPESQGGMYVVRGRLPPEVAAVLMRAVEAASDALFKKDREGGNGPEGRAGGAGGERGTTPDPAHLRADAVGLVAERALAAGFQAPDAPISGSRAERYQVMLHVEEETLQSGNDLGSNGRRTSAGRKTALQPPLSELKDGTRVTAETARRLSCDAARVVVWTRADGTNSGSTDGSTGSVSGSVAEPGSIAGSDSTSSSTSTADSVPGSITGVTNGSGAITGAGRRRRTIPPATRRALEARDRGCRFPGCSLRFTDGHHIVHWADGGPTTLDNLVLLCRRHHRRVHEGQYQVCSGADGQIVFFTPAGRALYEAPPPPELPDDPVEELVRRNRDRDVVPDAWAAAPRWHRDGDIPWSVEAAAREALDPWDDEDDQARDPRDDDALDPGADGKPDLSEEAEDDDCVATDRTLAAEPLQPRSAQVPR